MEEISVASHVNIQPVALPVALQEVTSKFSRAHFVMLAQLEAQLVVLRQALFVCGKTRGDLFYLAINLLLVRIDAPTLYGCPKHVKQ